MKRSILLLPLIFVGFFLSTAMWMSIAFAAPADALADPLVDPAGAIDDVSQSWRQGWPVFVFAVVTIASLALGKIGKRYPKVTWLARFSSGDLAIGLGGTAAVATACYNAAAEGGSWTAIMTGGMAALLAYIRLDPASATDPGEEPPARAGSAIASVAAPLRFDSKTASDLGKSEPEA